MTATKKKVAKKKVVKAEKYELVNDTKVAMTEEEAYAFCEETKQLKNGIQVAFVNLGFRLFRIREEKLYQPNYNDFHEYCNEIGETEGNMSKIISIYEKFVLKFGYDQKRLGDIGSAKLYTIKKVSETQELADYWLEQAELLPVRELKKKVDAFVGGTDIDECEHKNTHLVRKCDDCPECWEEYGKDLQSTDVLGRATKAIAIGDHVYRGDITKRK